jgi:hypothetical protein
MTRLCGAPKFVAPAAFDTSVESGERQTTSNIFTFPAIKSRLICANRSAASDTAGTIANNSAS